MIIAAAQTKPVPGNTEANIADHLRLIEKAAQKGVQLIAFPEMSLTGYEREKAAELAFSEKDGRLDAIKDKANDHNMIIVAGAPIRINDHLHIGAFIFCPNETIQIYTKQFLHSGEELFFQPSSLYNPVLTLEKERISLAICSDIANPVHSANAAKKNTTLYIAGIFYTPGGIAEAHQQLSAYARDHSMHVLMANYGGPSYTFQAGGQSGYWNHNGELVAKACEKGEELLIVEKGREG